MLTAMTIEYAIQRDFGEQIGDIGHRSRCESLTTAWQDGDSIFLVRPLVLRRRKRNLRHKVQQHAIVQRRRRR